MENLLRQQPEANSSLYLGKINIKEIEKIIDSLKKGSAPGIDNITSDIAKKIGLYISKPLCSIFNLCIKKGTFPDFYKKAVISPIYKKVTAD